MSVLMYVCLAYFCCHSGWNDVHENDIIRAHRPDPFHPIYPIPTQLSRAFADMLPFFFFFFLFCIQLPDDHTQFNCCVQYIELYS